MTDNHNQNKKIIICFWKVYPKMTCILKNIKSAFESFKLKLGIHGPGHNRRWTKWFGPLSSRGPWTWTVRRLLIPWTKKHFSVQTWTRKKIPWKIYFYKFCYICIPSKNHSRSLLIFFLIGTPTLNCVYRIISHISEVQNTFWTKSLKREQRILQLGSLAKLGSMGTMGWIG